MYVSAKREETLLSIGKTAERRLGIHEGARSTDLLKKRAFSKALKDKQGLNDRRDLQVSDVRKRGESADKPEVKKPDFNSEKSQAGRKNPPLKVRQDRRPEQAERSKESEQFEQALRENDRELAKIGKDSKQEESAFRKQTSNPAEEPKQIETLKTGGVEGELPDAELIASLLSVMRELPLEGANVETDLRSAAEVENVLQGSLDETLRRFLNVAGELYDLESETPDFAKEFSEFLQKAGIEEGKLQDFLKGPEEAVKEPEAEGTVKGALLQDLMAKLNVSEMQLKKGAEVAESQSFALSEEAASEDALQGAKSGERSEEKPQGSQERETEFSRGGQKAVEGNSDKQGAKPVEEGFATNKARLEETKIPEKTSAVFERDLKSNAKTEVFEQIKNHIIKQSVKTGKSEMLIKLTPEELGRVELKIEVHKDQVIAKMNVASQMVKEAIESNLSDLKSSLKDKGYDVTSFDVNLSDHSQESDAKQYRQRTKGMKAIQVEESAEAVSRGYIKTLEGLERGSTFEELA